MAEITLKSAKKLYLSLGHTITELEKDCDLIISLLKKSDSIENNDIVKTIRGLFETKLTLDYVNLDLCAAYRHYLMAGTNYEERHAIKNLNTIMHEGYKKLYGFTQKQNTFWKCQVKDAVESYPEFKDEYIIISALLTQLQTNEIFDKESRDLAVHYDNDPRKVYDMLAEINAEEVSQRFSNLFLVFTQVLEFLKKINTKTIDTLIQSVL